MRLILTLLALLAICACKSGGPTRPSGGMVKARSGNGRVFCSSDMDSFTNAVRAAHTIDKLFVRTGERLGYFRSDPVDIWLDTSTQKLATTYESCIVFNPADGASAFTDLILAHEFVHWHADTSPIRLHLPPVIVEGMCEVIATDLRHRWQEDRRILYDGLINAARERGDLPHLVSRLDIGSDELTSLPSGSRVHELYALGFALADSIGIDALREAAESGPVTPEQILEMAGVSPDGTGLHVRQLEPEPRTMTVQFSDADGTDLGQATVESPGTLQVPAGATQLSVARPTGPLLPTEDE